MNLLLVDIGNSYIKRVVVTAGTLGSVTYDPLAEIDRVATEIRNGQLPLALASVRADATDRIKSIIKHGKSKILIEIDSAIDKPVCGFYAGMGADRIANVAAAWSEYGGKCPVAAIDFGTATTITTASADGKFTGGFITLGLSAICRSLNEDLPQLPSIDPHQVESLEPGFDAYTALCRGTVSAHVGTIEKWISVFRDELGQDLALIATGGWSKFFANFLQDDINIDPSLTLKGIGAITRSYFDTLST